MSFDNLMMDGNGKDKGLYWVYHFGRWTGYDVTPEEWDDLIFKHSLGSLKDQQEAAEEIARRKVKEHKMGSWRGKPDSLQSPKTKNDASR